MKKNIIIITITLLILLIPSSIIGLIGYLTDKSFIISFLTSFVIIYILGIISNYITAYKTNIHIAKFHYETEKLNNSQSVKVSCSACGTINLTPVLLSERNVFTCTKCSKPNLIAFYFTTAVVTEELNIDIVKDNMIKIDKSAPDNPQSTI